MSKHDDALDETNPFRALKKQQFRDARKGPGEKKPEPSRHSSALPDDESEAFAAAMGGVMRLDAPSGKAAPTAKGKNGAKGGQAAPAATDKAKAHSGTTAQAVSPAAAPVRARDSHGKPSPTIEAALRDKAGIAHEEGAGTFALGEHPAFRSLHGDGRQADGTASGATASASTASGTEGHDATAPGMATEDAASPTRAHAPDAKTTGRPSRNPAGVNDRSRHAANAHTPHPGVRPSTENDTPDDDDMSFFAAVQGIKPLSGKGREVPPAVVPGRPATAGRDPVQDFLEGRIEFALEYTEEYLEGHVVGLDELTIGKLRAGQYSPEAHLDLHGLNALQAYEALVGFFRGAYHKGLRTVLVIPGRGRNSPDGLGILREKLQSWLTHDPFKRVVLAFCTAKSSDGGAGAVYVLLRKYKKSRGKIQWDRTPSDADLFL